MANLQPGECSGASDVSGESSDSTLELNIKTLDSRIFSFHVDKNILVSAFKEKIASQVGVPVGQQRLIFRGKDSTAGGPRNRIGQIAHSVVLGTLNVGDPGEAVVPDLSRVIGAVLNSIGIGNLAGGMQPGVQTSHGNETERSQVNAGSQSQGGNQFVPFQALHGQSAPYPMQNPIGAAIAVPSLNMPIPDSLNTLAEFMNRMELAFSQNGTQQNQSPTASGSLPTPELPMNSHGYPTVEALTIVLRNAQRLLSDHVVPALSQTAGRLDQEGGSSDPAVRGQVQTESVQLGVAMQHLGALLLELGRTILTLRFGQSPGESSVNAGPAVYISPSGPNPIMVQFHLKPGAALAPIVPMVGNRAPNGEEMRGLRVNGASGEFGQPQVSSGVNVTTTAVPARPAIISVSGAVQPVAGVPQASDSSSIPSIVADINAQLRSLAANRQSENHAPSGMHTAKTDPSASPDGGPHNSSGMPEQAESLEGPSRSSQGNNIQDGSSGVPLGLGLGGLQPKRRARQPTSQAKNSDGASSSRAVGQHVLQSLASLSSRGDANSPSSGQPSDLARGVIGNMPTTRRNADDHVDVADAMSQVLQSPSLDGLLAGVSQQTGVGSPDMLRNMLQQFTQNPAMRNTVNQIAQQIDTHDLGSMFSGLDSRGQGGGFDLSRMMQQMMPIVSQALGGVSSINPSSEQVLLESGSRRDMIQTNNDPQIDLRQVVQRLEDQRPSEEIFRSLVDRRPGSIGRGSWLARHQLLSDFLSKKEKHR
ncbi:hypothetical protein DH2020_035217 [Rehmannia glutinosa]|uniref:Ubiquitin-like domain-containing protein n=1 Tax=Rehmannia glutinosa TaxID=99300 RepID=A0ABR0V9B4_REHGL